MPRSKPPTPDNDIESSLAKLETIVASIENGEQTLEQSLKAFEEGTKLSHAAQKALAEAEQRVGLLLEKNNEPVSAAFLEEEVSE